MLFREDKTLLELLVFRLERISVDSYWAHRASGIRGSLLRILEDDITITPIELERLTRMGFFILEQAIVN